MKLPDHIFALNKAEQRVVILILLALLVLAVALHYRDRQSPAFVPVAAPAKEMPAMHPPADEDAVER